MTKCLSVLSNQILNTKRSAFVTVNEMNKFTNKALFSKEIGPDCCFPMWSSNTWEQVLIAFGIHLKHDTHLIHIDKITKQWILHLSYTVENDMLSIVPANISSLLKIFLFFCLFRFFICPCCPCFRQWECYYEA